MKDRSDRALIFGALLVGLVIAAIVWFLAISPKLSSAQVAKEEAVAQKDTNGLLEVTLLQREKSAKNVPDYTRELYAIRDILPATEDVPSVRRAINDVMSSVGLVVDRDSISAAIPIEGGLSLLAPMERVGLTSEIEGMAFSSLTATPFSLDLTGPADQVFTAITLLQSNQGRYILIDSLSINAITDEVSGSVRVAIGGAFFTLDRGNPAITIRPDERPWPGTDEETVDNPESPFAVVVPAGEG